MHRMIAPYSISGNEYTVTGDGIGLNFEGAVYVGYTSRMLAIHPYRFACACEPASLSLLLFGRRPRNKSSGLFEVKMRAPRTKNASPCMPRIRQRARLPGEGCQLSWVGVRHQSVLHFRKLLSVIYAFGTSPTTYISWYVRSSNVFLSHGMYEVRTYFSQECMNSLRFSVCSKYQTTKRHLTPIIAICYPYAFGLLGSGYLLTQSMHFVHTWYTACLTHTHR